MGAAVQRSYNAEEVEAGLMELACWHGNTRQASRTTGIPQQTLQDWKTRHADRLEALEAQIVPRIREKLAAQYEQIATRSAEIALEGLDQFATEMPSLPVKELAGAIRNITTSGAIGVDKASLMRGLPTEIRETRNADDILKTLSQKFPGMFVEGSAEEMSQEIAEGQPAEGSAERELPRVNTDANTPAS